MYEFAVGTEALFGERYAQWANLGVPGVDLDRARAASPPCGLTSPAAGPTSFPRWPTRTYRGRFLSGAKWALCSERRNDKHDGAHHVDDGFLA